MHTVSPSFPTNPPRNGATHKDVVVLPAIGKKAKERLQKDNKQMITMDLEFSPRQSLVTMRQVSGLGMEDPVYGSVSNHSRRTQKVVQKMPCLFEDMRLEDIPADMRCMVSVYSGQQHLAAGDLSSMDYNSGESRRQKNKSRSNATLRLHHSTNSFATIKRSGSPQKQSASLSKMLHLYVPPQSIQEMQGPEDSQCDTNNQIVGSPRQNRMLIENHHSKQKSTRPPDFHQSCQFISWETHSHNDTEKDDSKLHSSDSQLMFEPRRQDQHRKKPNGMEGFELKVNEFSRAVSGLTTAIPVEGLEVQVATGGLDRTVSGLTTAVPTETSHKEHENDDDSVAFEDVPKFSARTVKVDGELVSVPVLDIKATKQQRNLPTTKTSEDKDIIITSHCSGALHTAEDDASSATEDYQKFAESLRHCLDSGMGKRPLPELPTQPFPSTIGATRRSAPVDTIPSPVYRQDSVTITPEAPLKFFDDMKRRQMLLGNKVDKKKLDDSMLFRHAKLKASRREELNCSLENKSKQRHSRKQRSSKKHKSDKLKSEKNLIAKLLSAKNASFQATKNR